MTDSFANSALAVDGGGTRCRFMLLHNGSRHTFDAGRANVSTDFAAAVEVLVQGARRLAEQSGLPPERAFEIPTFIGMAGVTGPAMIERLRAALPFTNASYTDDRPAALRGALGTRDGAIAHCGTGSFFASEIGGTRRLAGGWGSVLGDEASAQWIGRRLLAVTLQSVDGFRQGSPLTEDVLTRFGDAAGIVRFAGTADPSEFGALAPMVTNGLLQDDPVAAFLMREAAEIVADGLQRIGWQPGLALCLTGGIGPHYKSLLPQSMQSDFRPPESEPIEGAMALAIEHARGAAR